MVGVVLFSRSGSGSCDRAEEKRALLEQFAAGQQSTVEADARIRESLPRYQHVRLAAATIRSIRCCSTTCPRRDGPAGLSRAHAAELEQGGWLLVDRGWIPPGATREQLPAIESDDEPRTIVGRLDRLPEPGMRLGDERSLRRSLAARAELSDAYDNSNACSSDRSPRNRAARCAQPTATSAPGSRSYASGPSGISPTRCSGSRLRCAAVILYRHRRAAMTDRSKHDHAA